MRNFFLNINGINNLMLAFVLSCAMACTPDKSEQEPNLTKTFTVNGEILKWFWWKAEPS